MNPLLLAIVVAIAGGVGASSRLIVDSAVSRHFPGEIPSGTVVVNVVGSFVAGLVVGAALAHGLSLDVRTVVVTGFCGGLTTWSAAMVETIRLFDADRWARAVLFGLGGFILSIAGAAAGLAIVGA